MTIRLLGGDPAEMRDLEPVLDEAPGYTRCVTGAPPRPADARNLVTALPDGKSRDDKFVLGIRLRDRMVGCADLIRGYPDSATAFLGLLLISEKHRRQGIGRRAYELIEELIRSWRACDRIRIAVVRANEEVLSFWTRLGFAPTGDLKPYRQGAVVSDTIVLEKRLSVDSGSVGDPGRFLSLERLDEGLRALPAAPRDAGRVALIVSRGAGGRRETPARVRLEVDGGVPGDAWGRRAGRKPEAQIAVMQADVARLIANGQPLFLSGDNLFLDLDLSAANLPPGSRLRAGGAELEVTTKAHNGCRKFRARFGEDALRFTANPETRHRNLRGIYLRVVRDGDVSPGDPVEVLSRGPASSKEAK